MVADDDYTHVLHAFIQMCQAGAEGLTPACPGAYYPLWIILERRRKLRTANGKQQQMGQQHSQLESQIQLWTLAVITHY